MKGDWLRLADYVINRRAHLDYTQEALAEAAGVNVKTIGRLERNEASVNNTTLGKIERALLWAPGSMRAILAGGEPAELPDPAARLNEAQRKIARATFNEWRKKYGDKQAREMWEEALADVPESGPDDQLGQQRGAG